MAFLVTVGVEPNEVEKIRSRVEARVVSYPGVPNTYAFDGKVRMESGSVMGRFVEPTAIIYYGYFEGPEVTQARRAIALSSTPSFPDIRSTFLLDDRVQALVMAKVQDEALTCSELVSLPHGYMPAGSLPKFEGARVANWGNRHAGEGKLRLKESEDLPEPSIIEPFIHGRSERILLIRQRFWHLRYESADWRKNVQATVTVLEQVDPDLLNRATWIARKLNLNVAGVDFIVDSTGRAYLLEVNAYPGFEDFPEASDAFVDEVVRWVRTLNMETR